MSDLADTLLALSNVDQRIDDSSFGTQGARELRSRTAPEVAETIVERLDQHHRHRSAGPDAVFARLKGAAFHELVAAARQGDHEATATLFAWIHPAVVRYCRMRIGRTGPGYTAADDIAQEVCLAVLGALPRYTDDPASFLPFVYGIAAHKVADHHRRNDLPTAALDLQGMRADVRSRLVKLLDTLAPRQREILVLRLVMGLSAQETAIALGLTATAVRVAQHRALAKLRAGLSPSDWKAC